MHALRGVRPNAVPVERPVVRLNRTLAGEPAQARKGYRGCYGRFNGGPGLQLRGRGTAWPGSRGHSPGQGRRALPKASAGLLMFRRCGEAPEVLLVHPGGPFWTRRDQGAWSIPKGEFAPDEDRLAAARREFEEETGIWPEGEFIPLSPRRQPSGKVVHAWAFEGDCDPTAIVSNTFVMEWPPRSGRRQEFPEVDRAEWFRLEEAKQKLVSGQAGLVEELERLLARKGE
jgi:predicted NUDIX family NTP pyrophosphohydrolase